MVRHKDKQEQHQRRGGRNAVFAVFHHRVANVVNHRIQVVERAGFAVEQRIQPEKTLKQEIVFTMQTRKIVGASSGTVMRRKMRRPLEPSTRAAV